jgi:hypothetical protein
VYEAAPLLLWLEERKSGHLSNHYFCGGGGRARVSGWFCGMSIYVSTLSLVPHLKSSYSITVFCFLKIPD